jgi:hypothetical protein
MSGEWLVCSVLELADAEKFGQKGPSLWDCMESCMDTNMKARVYTPRMASEKEFKLPVLGGEPIVRWIFLQVWYMRATHCTVI